MHSLLKLNTGLWAKERKRPSSAANCSPPRPSNAGVALAELVTRNKTNGTCLQKLYNSIIVNNNYQSTKYSIFPSLGASGSGVSISTFTHTKTSELANRKRADPLALLTMSISNSNGL